MNQICLICEAYCHFCVANNGILITQISFKVTKHGFINPICLICVALCRVCVAFNDVLVAQNGFNDIG
jgi:hypothetical protein